MPAESDASDLAISCEQAERARECPRLDWNSRSKLIWKTVVPRLVVMVPLSVGFVVGLANAASASEAKLRLVAVGEAAGVRVSGSVAMPATVAAARVRRSVVLFSLAGDGRSEQFEAALDSRHRFAVTHATRLVGVLRLRARVRYGTQQVGAAATASVTVKGLSSAQPIPSDATTTQPPISTAPLPAAEQLPPPEREREPIFVPCSPPVLPNAEKGMGIVTGSIYKNGGPGPGVIECEGGTVTVTGEMGEVVASEKVSYAESYAIAVPPGRYMIAAVPSGIHIIVKNEEITPTCGNLPVFVAAGQTSEASIYCEIP